MEASLGTFARVAGIEPTSNAAIRHADCWRKASRGSKRESGQRFVERILTTVATCRQQSRNVLAFLTTAVQAARNGDSRPSLLKVGV